MNVSVRVKLEEEWIKSDGVTKMPLFSAVSGKRMAIVNMKEDSGWTKRKGYYYYDHQLEPGETTETIITGVTLNCDANLDIEQDYSDANYHLKITAQTIQSDADDIWNDDYVPDCDSGDIYDRVACGSNDGYDDGSGQGGDELYTIDFTRKAVVSSDVYTANGNGIDPYRERGETVYYYRGQINDNNVIWANKCWKILRTTATGGTKLVYNGEVSDGQCNATGENKLIRYNNNRYFRFNNIYTSPADAGYMYGERFEMSCDNLRASGNVFANAVDYNDEAGIYTLKDTFTVSSWTNEFRTISQRYHYTCGSSATTCSSIRYLNYVRSDYSCTLNFSGAANIEKAKEKMFDNSNDSNAKSIIDGWFEAENLDGHIAGTYNYENDLEDAVFCNDRSYSAGLFSDEEIFVKPDAGIIDSVNSAYSRNAVKNSNNNFEPTLDCLNKNDAFTKNDTANGNGRLKHKIGLITADELTMAGSGWSGYDNSAYLYTGKDTWTMSPRSIGSDHANEFHWNSTITNWNKVNASLGLRPVVSLKAGTIFRSGDGTSASPYVVKNN